MIKTQKGVLLMKTVAILMILLLAAVASANVGRESTSKAQYMSYSALYQKYSEGAQKAEVARKLFQGAKVPRAAQAVDVNTQGNVVNQMDRRKAYYELYQRGTIERSKQAYKVGLQREKTLKQKYRENQAARIAKVLGKR